MKVLIDISEEDYKEIKDPYLLTAYWANIRAKEAIRNGTPIPDNATNGDVIKVVFPNTESRLDENTGIMLVKWVDGTIKTFKENWWDAPYKGR